MKKILSLILSTAMLVSSFGAFGTSVQAATVEENLKSAGFPDSYISDLATLQKAHSNWKFVAFKTGLNFDDAVKGELKSTPTTEENLRAYLDPRNWLNEKYVFQFESIKKSDATQSVSSVNAILKSTWMADSKITYLDTQGASKTVTDVATYADAMIKASNDSNMSANYIAAKIRQENGGTINSATAVCGTKSPFKGMYNYFNIGAYTTASDGLAWAAGFLKANKDTKLYSDANAGTKVADVASGQRMTYILKSGEYYKVTLYNELADGKYEEKQTGYILEDDVNTTYIGNNGRPWTDPYKAIYYGAKYIANSYLTYQFTMYLQKYNVNAQSGSLYSHEYMTNVSGAASEGYHLYSGYLNAGLLNSPHTFYIPVFNNMPNDNSNTTTTTTTTTTTKNYTPAKVKLTSLTAQSGHKIKAKWNKCSTSATGYQIYWAKDKNFKKIVAKTKITGRRYKTYTGKNFTKGRKYYVKIRAFKKAGGKTYYGPWSNIKGKTSK